MTSVLNRCRSDQRRYIRRSISAQSVASVPPAPALIDEDRAARVVLAGEQEQRPLALEVAFERCRRRAVELRLELGVARLLERARELGLEVAAPCEQPRHMAISVAEAVGLAQDLLCRALVVPEAGLRRAGLELGRRGAPWPGGQRRPEVDRIRSTRSRTARGVHLVPDPEILEQDRTELDQPKGRSCSGRRRGSRRDSSRCGGRRRNCRRSRARPRSCSFGNHARRR